MEASPPPEVQALRKVPFFEGLTSEDLERVARMGKRRAFLQGEPIVEKGTSGGGLFVILSGTATVETGGRTHTLGAGSFFGEMALLSDRPRSATVVAAEPVEAMAIEAMYFKPFLMKNPSVAVALLEGLADRLREVQERVGAGEDSAAEGAA